MALIYCSECGKEISSTAKSCVHCGYHFVVCPECGEILAAGTEACTKCGYRFVPQAVSNPITQQEQEAKSSDFEEITNRVTADNSFQKKIKILKNILGWINSIPFFVVVLGIALWAKSEPLDQVLNYQSTRNLCTAMIVIGGLFGIVDFVVFNLLSEIVTLRCAGWIAQKKVNYMSYLQIFRNGMNDDKTIAVYTRIKEAAFYAENKSDKKRCIAEWVIVSLLTLLFFIFLTVVLSEMCDKIMEWIVLQGADFDYTCLLRAISLVVGYFVLLIVILIVFGKLEKKNYKLWLQKHGLAEQTK